jgi:carbamoyl-phosphate synthase large subunit
MVLPTYKVKPEHLVTIKDYTRRLGLALNVRGLMNVQYAIKNDKVYVIEVNPRASRTTPFISKATGVPMAKVAAKIAAGKTLAQLGLTADLEVRRVFVKESVLPFVKFQGSDILLGPEMKSTGEVMGIARGVGLAFAKAQAGAGTSIPTTGSVFISVHDNDKAGVLEMARFLHESGFQIIATRGTAAYLEKGGVPSQTVAKVGEAKPDCVDLIRGGQIQLVINTPLGQKSFFDDTAIRKQATQQGILALTTLTAAAATVDAIRALRTEAFEVESLQEILSA